MLKKFAFHDFLTRLKLFALDFFLQDSLQRLVHFQTNINLQPVIFKL